MLSTPKIEAKEELRYAAISKRVSMQEIPVLLPPLIGQVYQWLVKNNIEPAGPPFFRYRSMKDGEMLVDVGWPVRSVIKAEGNIEPGDFPAGNYLTVQHTGPYSNLKEAHIHLEKYARENNLKEKQAKSEGEWDTTTEFYPTDPTVEKDPQKWVTEIQVLLAD